MRIAIIGAGISGLVAAYRLQEDHEITVFEANHYFGGHTNTVDVEWNGERHAIDTGFIVFNDWTYPNFIALLDELGVPSRPTTMSFSVSDERSGLEYNGHSLNTMFAQRRNLLRPGFHRMLADIVRFNRQAPKLLGTCDENMTVGEFLPQYGYSRQFAAHYLLPMGSAIWSCPPGTFAKFPIRFIVEFYKNHGLLNVRNRPTWRVVQGGSRSYVVAMVRRFKERICLGTPITQVRRLENRVELTTQDGFMEEFDHVVFACHSDQAIKILGSGATQVERELLGAFPYSKNIAVLHTDKSLLPRAKRAWASWNYLLSHDDTAPSIVTYNMNILQGICSESTFCVSLNCESRISTDRILGQFEYHHPVFTTQRANAQARHKELIGPNRTSFCGAYWGNGFHEDGVNSALAVVEALNQSAHKQNRSLAGSASAS